MDVAQRFPGEPVDVDFLKADLDGSGQFQHIIAFYSQSANYGFYLRVFKQQGAALQLIGEQEDQHAHGGWGARVELVDIDGDGIPEVDVSGTDSSGRQIMHEYFRWTGNSLHELLDPREEMANDGALADIDGDGILELIVLQGARRFRVYKFNGTDFKLSATVDRDPLGAIGADGWVNIVRAHVATLRPNVFALGEIKAARQKNDGDRDSDGNRGGLRFAIGKLSDLRSKPSSVEDIDAITLVLGTNLRPIRSHVRPAARDEDDDDSGHRAAAQSVLDLEFSRPEVLRFLPRLKLTAPLAPGDKLQLLLHGKMKNGTRVSAAVSVSIKGDRNNDQGQEKHGDK